MSIFDPGKRIDVPERFRFECRVVDTASGETIISDFCYLTGIDQLGGCDSVEMHLYALLRAFRNDLIETGRKAKAEAA